MYIDLNDQSMCNMHLSIYLHDCILHLYVCLVELNCKMPLCLILKLVKCLLKTKLHKVFIWVLAGIKMSHWASHFPTFFIIVDIEC